MEPGACPRKRSPAFSRPLEPARRLVVCSTAPSCVSEARPFPAPLRMVETRNPNPSNPPRPAPPKARPTQSTSVCAVLQDRERAAVREYASEAQCEQFVEAGLQRLAQHHLAKS